MNPLIEFSTLSAFAGSWGDLILDLTIKGSLLLAIIGLACTILRRASASTRHLFWTLGVTAMILLPVFAIGLPAWQVEALPDISITISGRDTGAGLPAEPEEAVISPTAMSPEERPSDQAKIDQPAKTQQPATDESISGQTTASQTTPISQLRAEQDRSEAPKRTSAATWALFTWLAGTLLVLAITVIGAVRLWWLVRDATPLHEKDWATEAALLAERMGFKGPVRILRSNRLVTPMSWGLWRGVILLPSNCIEWSDAQRRDVLIHEISHLKRRDCLSQAIANLASILYWFNPLVWYAGARLRTERERACDDQVLLTGSKPSTYADNLLDIAVSLASENRSAYVSVAMARRSEISSRLMAVLDPKTMRRTPGRGMALAASLLIVAVALPLAALSPIEGAKSAIPLDRTSPVEISVPAKSADKTDFGDDARFAATSHEAPDHIRAEIEAVNKRYEQLIKQRDSAGMAEIYTIDAEKYTYLRPGYVGREEIQAYLQELIDEGATAIKLEIVELYLIGEVVYEIGRFTVLGEKGLVAARGTYMAIWKKVDGQWKVHRDFSTI